MAKRESKWTTVYWDIDSGKPFAYVRITPEFLDLESLGFPHGLALANKFETEEQAVKYADTVDFFFEALVEGNKVADIDIEKFEHAPCYICGYSGAGYFQPERHSCAALYHTAKNKAYAPN